MTRLGRAQMIGSHHALPAIGSCIREARRLTAKRAVMIAACVLAVIVVVPWQPRGASDTLDLSWELLNHDAFARGLHFGTDVVFTFGPYGFLFAGYDPRTFTTEILLWLAIASALVVASAEAGQLTITSPLRRAALVLALAVVVSIPATKDAPFLLLPFLLARLDAGEADRRIVATVAFMLGLASLVKFSFLVAAAPVVLIVLAHDLVRRRAPWSAVAYAGGTAFFWIGARQPIDVFPEFIRNSGEIASGYSTAMSLSYHYADDLVVLVWFAAVAVALTALAFAARQPALALATAAVSFVAWKGGFVRYDGHDIMAVALLAAIAIASPPLRRSYAIVAAAALALLAYDLAGRNQPPLLRASAGVVARQTSDFFALIAHGRRSLDRTYGDSLATLRSELTARPAGRSFDIYPVESAILEAWALPSSRRPVLQSYVAYTPHLLGLNAAHLRKAAAPDVLLFDVTSFDGRLPSLDDGFSWPEILRRYDFDGKNGHFLVLRRRTERRAAIRSDLEFARIDIEPTFLGRAASFLLRAPAVYASVTTDDGRSRRFRIIAGNARAGFLLSPLVVTTDDFAALYGGGKLPRVTSVRIEPNWYIRSVAIRPWNPS